VPVGVAVSERVPVLLSDGGYYGTLAAARALGRDGVPVTIADPSRVAPALWSRHVSRRLRCPPVWDVDRFVDWLAELGRAGPRHIVFPTSDDLSFVLALRRDELEGPFVFYQPGLDSLMGLLDKGRLLDHARAARLDVPETWLPEGDAEAERVIREAGGMLIIKPRTQALLRTHVKGVLVGDDGRAARDTYAQFRQQNMYGAALAGRFPEATRPMVQRFHTEAIEKVYSLAGFRNRSGDCFVVRAANKVLQRPRPLGVGLCFEDAPVDAELSEGVRRLCERVGYFGVFEAEFIRVDGRSLLIDFNARLYNQMAFDLARGLPLPQLFYGAALGQDDEVARRVTAANGKTAGPGAFCNGFSLTLLLGARRLSGNSSRDNARHWRMWLDGHRGGLVDAVADRDDPRPLAFEVVQQLYSCVRHPRAFVRALTLDETTHGDEGGARQGKPT
jgi:D-aspartate ligase